MASLKKIVTFGLDDTFNVSQSHQMSFADSMSAIENRHTRTSLDYEVLIRDLKSKHRKELREKEERFQANVKDLKVDLENSNFKINELNGRLDESRKSREDLIDSIKKARKIYERRILELEKCLEEATLKCQSFDQKDNNRDESLYEKIDELKQEIETIRNQNDEVGALLQTERSEGEKKEEKILELGKMIERMDKYLHELEKKNDKLYENSQKAFHAGKSNGAEKGAVEVLEHQLELSQSALETCRNDLSNERHKVSRLEEEMGNINKDFGNAKIDVRFLTRENKQLTDKIANFNKDHSDSVSKINDLEAAKAENDQQILNLQNQIQLLQESQKSSVMDKNLSHKVLEDNRIEIQSLKKELSVAKLAMKSIESQKEELQILKQKIEEMKLIISEKDSQLEDSDRKIETLNKSISMLREACVLLENQLEKFENVLTQKGHELDNSVRTISTLEAENVTLRSDIKKVRTDLNEVKSLKIHSEKKLQDVELCLQTEEMEKSKEMTLLLSTVSDLQSKNEDLLRQVLKLTGDFQHSESTRAKMSQTIEHLTAENSSFKLEVSKLISELVTLKDLNISLKTALEEAIRKAEHHKSRYENVSKEKGSLIANNAETALKVEATLNQQMKLIEHLKSQNELLSAKKKKFRLFGTDKETPVTTPLRESNTPNTMSTPRRLIIEHKAVKNLEEMSASLKNELAILKTRQEIITNKNPTLPNYKKEECILLKNKSSSLGRNPPLPRMSHDIPHRFVDKLAMKTSAKCWKCQEPIYFGRYFSICNVCPSTFHVACAITAQNTCGLPKDVVLELEKKSWKAESDYTLDESDTLDDSNPEGWIQLAKERWEQCYVRLEKHKICFYEDQSCKNEMRKSFPLNNRTRVELSVDVKLLKFRLTQSLEESRTAFLIKVVSPKDTNNKIWNDEDAIYMLTANSREKRFWTRAIMKFSSTNTSGYFDETSDEGENESDENDKCINKKRILKQDEQERLDINCIQHIEKDLFLLGCEEGLFSRRNDPTKNSDSTVKIDGVGAIYQIEFVNQLNLAFLIEGPERRFVSTALGLLKACSQAAACSKPKLTVQSISGLKYCHLFCIQKTGNNDICIGIATQKNINILVLRNETFVMCHQVSTRETVTCMLPTRDSLIFGCDKLYELDLKTFELDEFIDESDHSMFYLLFSCKEFASFPMAVLDVSSTTEIDRDMKTQMEEYLLCFPDMATFVDSYGRRTRCEDIVWSKLPLAVGFQHPNLYVMHFTSLEIIPLTYNSYTRSHIQDPNGLNNQISIIPETKSISLTCPRLIGSSAICHSVFVGCIEKHKTEVFEIQMDDHKAKANDSS